MLLPEHFSHLDFIIGLLRLPLDQTRATKSSKDSAKVDAEMSGRPLQRMHKSVDIAGDISTS